MTDTNNLTDACDQLFIYRRFEYCLRQILTLKSVNESVYEW